VARETGLTVKRIVGPVGGDLQIGSLIACREVMR
jgi:methylglyoxal synthase